ncbi:S41 family peptidase [Melioribacter sp. Ez-97]|uniref:S41 family peptidase n=1 Tax=Melioribacter sp. Ez-97 TaxID=3423434 RepID=UPI003ED93B81
MKKITLTLFLMCVFSIAAFAQVDARMFQNPDVSENQIVFSYGDDLWIVDKNGGTAHKLTSPKGMEMFPRFSPDGKAIAFMANYFGNIDIFIIPSTGGAPERITNHGYTDRLIDWYPDGKSLIFASMMNSGRERFNQFFKVSKEGGLPQQLPVPYGEMASVSPDGKKIAYTPRTRAFRTWKRYRGGMNADIWIFDLEKKTAELIIEGDSNDEFPMWRGDKIYFLSDRGSEKRFNIWQYDIPTKALKQITKFKDFDIHFPALGQDEIVFEAGGAIYLLNLNDESTREVKIKVVTDNITLLPKEENVSKYLSNGDIAPDGNRVLLEARGEIFSAPVKEGVTYNLSNSSASAERYPAWSPDGKYAAYWSDINGEYNLALYDFENPGKTKILTDFKDGYRYNIYWSPDGKKLAFIDKAMQIYIYNIDKDKTIKVDKCNYLYQGGLDNFKLNWSPDGKWLAYAKDLTNRSSALFLFNLESEETRQLTSGFYSDFNPVFDPEGKYLFFMTNRELNPIYSDLDNTWIYSNTTKLAVAALSKDTKSLMAAKNDTTAIKKEEKDKNDKEKDDKKKDDKKDEKSKDVKIDLADFENRVELLPVEAGNFSKIAAVKGKLIFHRFPNTGSSSKNKPLKYLDLESMKEKDIVDDADDFKISADGNKILVVKDRGIYVIDAKENQKLSDRVSTDNLVMNINPKEEWKQIFNEVWRFERDFFYDPNMHGVDWEMMKERYGKLIDNCVTRGDVNYVIGELISELNASHTYRGGGDMEYPESKDVGYLGVDWTVDNGRFKIKKIIEGAPWDAEIRSPLSLPSLKVNEGDYILAVNGVELDTKKAPWEAFTGLANKTVELTVNDKPTFEGSRKIYVKTLSAENRLRHLAWIESNRKYVDKKTNGKVGYIYVPNTGIEGQTELVRQFMAQFDKDGLIIDERFNSGGQIPDRFIELLNRKPLAYWAVRDGKNWKWPPIAHFGPKVMLINGWSGSGGDAFPDYFRKAGLGPLVGTRTWGGLIGITGAPRLIDGGIVTVPTFRMYDPDGKWFREGHGVDPDYEVIDDPALLSKGIDPQLDKAIEVIMDLIKKNPDKFPKQPPYEKR